MQNNRLGCLTVTGIISVLITSCAILGFALFNGGQMFTAGALNAQPGDTYGGVTSHAQITACSVCHVFPLGRETMADRCTACHTDIAEQMRDVAKLHGSIAQKSSAVLACRDCHPEHRGETALLTEMGGNSFPHEALGFSLKGHQLTAAGEAFTCADCHGENVTAFDPSTCDSCHRQMDIVFTQTHVLSFGMDCLACHDGVDRFGSDFTHSVFVFKLDGGHAGVPCTKCHLNARTLADLQSAPQDCYSCHKQDDEHNGEFGRDCAGCHIPNSWEGATFDHSRSKFPLTGAHAQVRCEDCHQNGVFKGTSSTCESCHAEPTEHAGQFGTDCAACHTINAWTPAAFNGDHTFPLDHGESGLVSCATCHPAGYKTYTCYGCHEHSESNIRSEHLEEGIRNFENCMECHADGREHDD
ncbi:MAG: hypothetical protein HY865_04020 [Chloroflexi bacterium]|nr:hypothetical protein [Chloroflexota bacterium]